MFSGKKETPTTRLRELSGSDFTVAKGEPDIRGWDVRDAAGRKFGTVHDLIFDIRAGKVRYLVLQVLDTPELELEKRAVLVPIGLAELDPSDNDVLLPTVNPFQLRALPRYNRQLLGAKAERDVAYVFGRQALDSNAQPAADVDEQFYNHDHFNQRNLLRRRPGYDGATPAHPQQTAGYQQPFPTGPAPHPDTESDEAYYQRTGRQRNTPH